MRIVGKKAAFRLSLQWKFLLCISLIIIPTMGILFVWIGIHHEKRAEAELIRHAKVLHRQIILTRQWISDCGGVWVKEESQGARGTSYFFDEKNEFPDGTFRRFTPSMVTRKLSDYSFRQRLYQFRLSSLKPLNPENRPGNFEKTSLINFERDGLGEAYRFESIPSGRFFRYMAPLPAQNACFKCHERDAAKNGYLGGLSVFLPADGLAASVKSDRLKLGAAGVGLIVLTTFTLFILLRRLVIRPLQAFETMTGEISEGHFEARVNLDAGDEFDKLGHSFNLMAKRLQSNRELLEKEIEKATRDLSEANRELKTLDKLKSDFLANMSHELRSPLTVIRGGIDYLNRTLELEDNRDYLTIMDKNLSRLINLVYDLFDFTKIEARKIDWSFERENLSVLVQEVIEIMSPLAMEKSISLGFQNTRDVFAEIDLERIEQVLVNLIDNAISFSEPETEIRIGIIQKGESATVSVRDQGCGIDPENHEFVFKKFSTVPAGDGRKSRGTGLGLAICKAIVEAHGGRIWVESESGESSTFFFTLPTQIRFRGEPTD